MLVVVCASGICRATRATLVICVTLVTFAALATAVAMHGRCATLATCVTRIHGGRPFTPTAMATLCSTTPTRVATATLRDGAGCTTKKRHPSGSHNESQSANASQNVVPWTSVQSVNALAGHD